MVDAGEFARRAYAAWNSNDLEGFVAFTAPDLRLRTSGAFPDLPAEYRGHDGVRQFWHDVRGPWDELLVDVEDVVQSGDLALVTFRFRARGREGVEVDARFFQVGVIKGDLLQEVEAFADEELARERFEAWKAAMAG